MRDKIPQSLLDTLADINVDEINYHIYTNKSLSSWLFAWHEKIKKELYDFANSSSGCNYYVDGHCSCQSREELLEEELKLARSDNQSLKNMIVKMCYERFGE